MTFVKLTQTSKGGKETGQMIRVDMDKVREMIRTDFATLVHFNFKVTENCGQAWVKERPEEIFEMAATGGSMKGDA